MMSILNKLAENKGAAVCGVSIISLMAVLTLQYVFNMQPCSTCIAERILVIIIGLLGLFWQLSKKFKWFFQIATGSFITFLGALSAYHANVLLHPGKVCSDKIAETILAINFKVPAFNWLLESKTVCGQGDDYFLGVLLPVWVLGLTLIYAFIVVLRPKKGG